MSRGETGVSGRSSTLQRTALTGSMQLVFRCQARWERARMPGECPDYTQVMTNLCPLCRQRKARRPCPAVGHSICSVCCGTKRQREIVCPPSCVYLSSAREHPAAVVQRRQELGARLKLIEQGNLPALQKPQLEAELKTLGGKHAGHTFKDWSKISGDEDDGRKDGAQGVHSGATPRLGR